MPVNKNYRDFAYFESAFEASVIHLDLKRVTVRLYRSKINGLENFSTEALKPAGTVRQMHAGDKPGINAGAIA
jgi:hypothetical protein